MSSRYNPVRKALLYLGFALARVGLIDRERVERTTDLSWPRIVTGLARMSKSAADVAMVGLALGPAAIAGVGFAAPFWGLAFSLGGGVAGGTISLVSQRFGADAHEGLAVSVKASAIVAVLITLPLAVAFLILPTALVDLIGSDSQAITYGADYLQIVGLGIPFAALNLVGSRTLVGADDAWTPMILRGGGAVLNVVLNAVFIFGLGMGVVGAALGTVLGNVAVTAAFAVGLAAGRLPLLGAFPIRIPLRGPHVDFALVRQLLEISAPLVVSNVARSGASFVRLWIVGLFGANVVAAYVVAMRVRGLMGAPGWGFGLASSSLVGQELGIGDETAAEEWATDIIRFAVATYLVVAVIVALGAEQIGRLFVSDPSIMPLVTTFIYVACVSVVWRGVDGGATGPLRASGDTNWPLYSKLVGMYLVALPIGYLGVVVPEFGIGALFVMIVAETLVPSLITYYRFSTETWKEISREYRPEVAPTD